MTRFASRLKVTISKDEAGTTMVLRGIIDEFAALAARVSELSAPLTVDLSTIDFINSEGVREWAAFLRASLAAGRVVLRGCSEPMVLLFNMATVAVDGAEVESLQAPYACTKCSADEMIELAIARDLADGIDSKPPEFPCKQCPGSLRFAGLPRRYLAFLETE